MNCPYCNLELFKKVGITRFECTQCQGSPRFSDWNEVEEENDKADGHFVNIYDFSVDFYFEINKYCYSITFYPQIQHANIKIYKMLNSLESETVKLNSVFITPYNVLFVVNRIINLKAFL